MFGSNDDQNQQTEPEQHMPVSAPIVPDTSADDQAAADTSSSSVAALSTPGTSDNWSPAATSSPSATSSDSDDLMQIKQQALQHLTPLVDHLDQTPEEKFRTTMMMIQTSDNQSLLNQAFATAKLITDDKARAQALLDIINEINYFTQQHTA